METKSFRTTEIINLVMIDRLVTFFIYPMKVNRGHVPESPEKHDHYELYYIRTGSLSLLLDGEPVTIRAGECLLAAPFTVHQLLDREPETLLFFAGFTSKGQFPAPLCKKPFLLSADESALLCELVEDGSRCFTRLPRQSNELGYLVAPDISRGRLQALKNKLEIFLIKLIESRLTKKTPAGRATVADAVYRYLTDHITDRVTLEQIARELSVSVSYVKQAFAKKYGRGVIDCFLDLKIDRAKQLIEETPLNFTQIADYLSFESENHLLKTFLKRTGKTPSAYLKQISSDEARKNEK